MEIMKDFVCTVCGRLTDASMWTKNDVCDHCRDFEYEDYDDHDYDFEYMD